MSSCDPTYDWSAIGATSHPVSERKLQADAIWKQRDALIDAGLEAGVFDQAEIDRLAELAVSIEYPHTHNTAKVETVNNLVEG